MEARLNRGRMLVAVNHGASTMVQQATTASANMSVTQTVVVAELHKQNFERTLREHPHVLVHFWAPCAPLRV
eukprot:4598596-Prymnesium_polylepis.1